MSSAFNGLIANDADQRTVLWFTFLMQLAFNAPYLILSHIIIDNYII